MNSVNVPADLRFDGDVIVVAGGSAGLGRRYALDLGRAGARVVVAGRSTRVADAVQEITAAGGTAVGVNGDVRDGERFVQCALDNFGRIDGLLVNAGIVRDRSFGKMTLEDWREILEVHADGAFHCAKAAWGAMVDRSYGRIVLTTSGAALYGNFGQANYSAAKGAVIGLMRTVALEGARKNILCNAVAPMASTGMTERVFDAVMQRALDPAFVSPFVLPLLHRNSIENGSIIEIGGGWASRLRWQRSRGLRLAPDALSPGQVFARWSELTCMADEPDYPASTEDCLNAAMGSRRAALT